MADLTPEYQAGKLQGLRIAWRIVQEKKIERSAMKCKSGEETADDILTAIQSELNDSTLPHS